MTDKITLKIEIQLPNRLLSYSIVTSVEEAPNYILADMAKDLGDRMSDHVFEMTEEDFEKATAEPPLPL